MKDASVESARFEPTVFGAVRRYRIMVAAFALAGMVAAIGYTLHHKGETYAAKASVSVPASRRAGNPSTARCCSWSRQPSPSERPASPTPHCMTTAFLLRTSIAAAAR